MINFKVTHHIADYVKVGEEYKTIEVESNYNCENFDDLQNFIMALVDFSEKPVKLTIRKKEVPDNE